MHSIGCLIHKYSHYPHYNITLIYDKCTLNHTPNSPAIHLLPVVHLLHLQVCTQCLLTHGKILMRMGSRERSLTIQKHRYAIAMEG